MSATTSHISSSRIEHLDVVRGWAIFLMVVIHTVRGVLARAYKYPDRVDMAEAVDRLAVVGRAFLYTTEPYISALFLTVSGFALAVAFRPGAGGYRPRLTRGLQLVLLSWLIHWIHAGVNPPYPFLSAEILYTIGLGVILFAPLAGPTRWRWPALAVATAVCVAITWFAEGSPNHWLARLAQGPGAHLPNLIFFPAGIGLAALWQGQRRIVWLGLLGGALAVVTVYHVAIAPGVRQELAEKGKVVTTTEAIFNKPFGRIVTDRQFVVESRFGSTYDLKWVGHKLGLVDQPPKKFHKRRSYWNKKLVLMPYLLAWMAITFVLAWLLWGPRTNHEGDRVGPWTLAAWPLAVMGRYPLMLYLLHLAVIAALVAGVGGNRAGPLGTLLAVVGMVVLCVVAAWGRLRLSGGSRFGGRG